MDYGFYAAVEGPFDAAVQRVTDELKQEGFGILSDIDVRQAMKDKLGVEIPAQRILGACNPGLAHRALQAEPDVGLLLPCNVTLREDGSGQVRVGFLHPETLVSLTQNPLMRDVAAQAHAKLSRVCEALGGDPKSGCA